MTTFLSFHLFIILQESPILPEYIAYIITFFSTAFISTMHLTWVSRVWARWSLKYQKLFYTFEALIHPIVFIKIHGFVD